MREEEEEAKRKSAVAPAGKNPKKVTPVKKSVAEGGVTEQPEEAYGEKEVENYLSHEWEKARDMEYYKYFFQFVDLNNILTVDMNAVFDKKKKKKTTESKKKRKKAKKAAAAAAAAAAAGGETHTTKAFDVFEGDDDDIATIKAESELVFASKEETKEKTEEESVGKPAVRKNSQPVETVNKSEEILENETAPKEELLLPLPPKKEPEIEASIPEAKEVSSEIKPTSAEAKEPSPEAKTASPELKEVPQATEISSDLPCAPEPLPVPIQKFSTKPATVKPKEKKKLDPAFLKATKAEYEELKKSAAKFFSEKTGSLASSAAGKQKKGSKKKKKKNLAPEPTSDTQSPSINMASEKSDRPPSEVTVASSETGTRKMSSASCASTNGGGEQSWPRKHSGDFHGKDKGKFLRYRRKDQAGRERFKEIATQTHGEFGWQNYPCPTPPPVVPPVAEMLVAPTQLGPQPILVCMPIYLDPKQFEVAELLNPEIEAAVKRITEYNLTMRPLCEVIKGRIEQIAQSVFSDSGTAGSIKTALYGSMAAGLALPSSDIDIAVLGVRSADGLEKLGEILAGEGFVKDCKVIATARVPVIKLVVDVNKLSGTLKEVKCGITEIKVDVTMDIEAEDMVTTSEEVGVPGKPKVSLVRNGVRFVEWVQTKLKEIPALKPVVLIMKMLLASNRLNVPYHGSNFFRFFFDKDRKNQKL